MIVRRRLAVPEAVSGPAATDHAIYQTLAECIAARLDDLRALEGLPPTAASGDRRAAVEEALVHDFRRGNAELEAWSTLYHRYVRVDLDLQMQGLAALTSQDLRTLRRRLALGVARLTGALIAAEQEARARQAALRMRLALPAAVPPDLVDLEAAKAGAWGALNAEGQVVVILHGAGGLGKTALARWLAHRLIDEGRIDDLAWLAVNEGDAIASRLLEALGLAEAHPDPASHLPALRAHGLTYRLLVVLDAAESLIEDATALRALLDALGDARVLMTSRVAPPAAIDTRVVTLHELDEGAAWALMECEAGLYIDTAHVSEATVTRRAEQFAQVWEAVGGNPLALRVAVGHLRFLAADRVTRRVGALPLGEGDLFGALYRAAWGALDGDARRVWLALLAFPKADAADLEATLQMPAAALERAILVVARRALAEVSAGEVPTYALHRLARAFLESLLDAEPAARETAGLCARALAGRLLAEDLPLETVFAHGAHLLDHAARLGLEAPAVVRLAARVHGCASALGRWAAWAPRLRAALDLALASGDRATLLAHLGEAERNLGRLDDAVKALLEAIWLAAEAGRREAEAAALVELAATYRLAGLAGAEPTARRALQAAEALGDSMLVTKALAVLAQLHLDAGHIDQALALLKRAPAPEVAGDARWQTLAGDVYLAQGQLDDALRVHQRALELAREQGHQPNQARALVNLGRAHLAAGDLDAAEASLERALALMDQTRDALGQTRARANLAVLYARRGRHRQAIDLLRAALAEQEHLGDRQGATVSRRNLAELHLQAAEVALGRNHPRAALRHLEEVEALYRALGQDAQAAQVAHMISELRRTYNRQAD